MKHLTVIAFVLMSILFCGISRAQSTGQPSSGSNRLWRIHTFNETFLVSPTDSTLARTRARLQKFFRDSLDFRFDLYIADSDYRFDSLGFEQVPEWGAGVAIPVHNRIVIKHPAGQISIQDFLRTVAHEYSHLALDRRVRGVAVPRWFNEGMAMLVSSQWGWQNAVSISASLLLGNYIPLEEIEKVNRFDQSKASLAYNESYLALQYLYETYGYEQVNIFLDSMAGNADIDRALVGAFGSDYAGFDEEFHLYLKSRFNLVTLIGDTVYFWLAMALILIVGAALAFRKRKSYYRKWEEEEKFASTDFDYGDPDNPEQTDDDESWRR